MAFIKENTEMKEQQGRQKYLKWIASRSDLRHAYFTTDTFAVYDAVFYSGATLCLLEIKNRSYSCSFFNKYGVELDRNKAVNLFYSADAKNAVPILATFTSDNYVILSDIRKATKENVYEKRVRSDNNHYNYVTKEMINLRNCRIK